MPGSAAATADSGQDDSIRSVIEAASPMELSQEVVSLEGEDGVFALDAGEVDVQVSRDHVTINGQGSEEDLSVSLPREIVVSGSDQLADGTVLFETPDIHVEAAAQVFGDGSVRILTVLKSADSPTEYTYEVEVPEGGRLVVEDDMSVSILDSGDNWAGGIAAPWAADAKGDPVPTTYRVEGNHVVQEIRADENASYPITADPWLGKTLISKVTLSYVVGKGTTYKVYPTTWGRWTGSGARWSAWKEVIAINSRINRGNLKDQFYCHFDVVRLRAPNKASWNLDSWRPDVSYASTIRQDCNPS